MGEGAGNLAEFLKQARGALREATNIAGSMLSEVRGPLPTTAPKAANDRDTLLDLAEAVTTLAQELTGELAQLRAEVESLRRDLASANTRLGVASAPAYPGSRG